MDALARDYASKRMVFEELLRQSARNSSYQLSVQLSHARSAVFQAQEKLLNAAMNHVAA
jgi:hypothetical protein